MGTATLGGRAEKHHPGVSSRFEPGPHGGLPQVEKGWGIGTSNGKTVLVQPWLITSLSHGV